MKFNQYLWNLYKNSPEGKAVISSFSDRKEWIDEEQLLERYNPSIKDNFNKEIICEILEDFWCYKVSDFEGIEYPSLDEAEGIYKEIISTGLRIEDEEVLKIGDFDRMLDYIPFLSMELNYLLADYFFPYLYIDKFHELKKLSDHFDIELPPTPKKPDYKARCMYYWELCKALYQFRTENNLTPDELSAFMYDYVPNLLSTEEKSEIPQPSQAWFIGGLIRGYGEHWTTGFWQTNQETKKGDILVHYETSPISAITCLWIAWIALGLSVIAILLWLCKYEPVTWTLFDSMIAFLSFVVGALAVMVGYNIFGLKNDLKNEIEEKLQDISDHHVIHTAKTMMYIEIRLLHMAMKLKNIADIRQSIYMMLETTEKTKDKEDIDYVINQLKELKTRYGYTLFDDAFTRKLKIKLGRIGTFSDSALLFLQDLEV